MRRQVQGLRVLRARPSAGRWSSSPAGAANRPGRPVAGGLVRAPIALLDGEAGRVGRSPSSPASCWSLSPTARTSPATWRRWGWRRSTGPWRASCGCAPATAGASRTSAACATGCAPPGRAAGARPGAPCGGRGQPRRRPVGPDEGPVDPGAPRAGAAGAARPGPAGARRALVVVIDTGLSADAADRVDGWLHDIVTAPGDVDPLDVLDEHRALVADDLLDPGAGHGTFVAGVVRQVAPGARVELIRALDTDGLGDEVAIARSRAPASASRRSRAGRAEPVLRPGGRRPRRSPGPGRRPARAPGVVVVAAAGNSASGLPVWPAASDRVLGVAALTADGAPADWSNRGDWVDCAAVGKASSRPSWCARGAGGAGRDLPAAGRGGPVLRPVDRHVVRRAAGRRLAAAQHPGVDHDGARQALAALGADPGDGWGVRLRPCWPRACPADHRRWRMMQAGLRSGSRRRVWRSGWPGRGTA